MFDVFASISTNIGMKLCCYIYIYILKKSCLMKPFHIHPLLVEGLKLLAYWYNLIGLT